MKIAIELAGTDQALPEAEPRRELSDLTLDDVFLRGYARKYGGEPERDLLSAFHEVVEAARRGRDES